MVVGSARKPAVARSDMYSVGAILFEMLNGRTQERDTWVASHPAADRLMNGCMAT